MKQKKDTIFTPGKSVELVFNLNSLSPVSRSCMIYENNTKKKEIILSQTSPRTLKTVKYDTLHLTILTTNDKNEKIRLGLECKIKDFIKYKLNQDTVEDGILLSYKETVQDVNIRSAFRIKPNDQYSILAKFECRNSDFYSGKHFKIFDISLSGVGFLIPNIPDKKKNPLIKLEIGDLGKIGIVLKENSGEDSEPEIKRLFNQVKVVRINKNFNPRYILIGCQFTKNWERDEEEGLGSFVHQLQLFEIRHLQSF